MGRRTGILLCLLAALASVPALAAPKGGVRGAEDAAIGVLLEDLDSLNTISSGHTKELGDLKAHVAALEEALKAALEAAKTDADKAREEDRKALEEARARLAALESRQVRAGRPLPWLIPMAELRVRMLYDRNRTDLSTARGDNDLYFQHRLRLGVTLEPRPGIQAVIVLQDAREWAEERTTSSNQHALDLFQGYLRFDDIGGTGMWVQAGRFQMTYGEGRQVAYGDWGAVGQAFDGLRLGWRKDRVMAVDAFATFVRDGFAPVFQGGWAQDPYGVFTGLHLSTDAVKWMDAELYGLYQDDGFADLVNKVGTVGARIAARPAKGLLLEGEAAVQFGRVTNRDLEARLQEATHLATAYALQLRYQSSIKTEPWVGAFFYSASGDANPWDKRDVAYRPVYPKNKGLLGNLSLFGWQGVWDVGPTLGLNPAKNLRIGLDWHVLVMSSNGGSFRGLDSQVARSSDALTPGATNRVFNVPSGGSRYLGHEMDLELTWKPVDVLSIGLGYSLFQPGAAAKRGQVLSVAERTQVVDGATVTVPYWKRDVAAGGNLAQRLWLEATLSL